MERASFVALAVLSVAVAAYALVAYGLFPLGVAVHPDMRAGFVAHPIAIYAHVFASIAALALGPFQFSARLRAHHPAVHRWMGRIYLGVGVLAGGLAGLYMSAHAHGGIVSKFGFAALAIAWLYTGLRAYGAIRERDVIGHRRWMIRNFALAFGAVTLRLWLPAAVVSGVPFDLAYPAVAWLCWVPNLIVAEWLVRSTGRGARRPAAPRPEATR
jgi:uncharacterized membrane protein